MKDAQSTYLAFLESSRAEDRKAQSAFLAQAVVAGALLASGLMAGPPAVVLAAPGARLASCALMVLAIVAVVAAFAISVACLTTRAKSEYASFVSAEGAAAFESAADYAARFKEYDAEDDALAQSYAAAKAAVAKRRLATWALAASAASAVLCVAFAIVYSCGL